MKKCPNCSTECLNTSLYCPNCKYSFDTANNNQNNTKNNLIKKEENDKRKNSNDPCCIGCLITFILIIGFFTSLYFYAENSQNNPNSIFYGSDERVRKEQEAHEALEKQKKIEQNIYNMERAKEDEELKHALELEENYQKSKGRKQWD